MEKTYCDLMLLASGVIAALAVSIIGIKIPSKQEFRKLRTARATLAASFITLSILNFICYFTGYDEDLDRLNTMIVAAFQALLLTGTLLVFIRPDVVTGKWVGLQVAAISIITALLYFVMFLFPGIYPVFFYTGAALLVLQLVLYSISFFKSQNMTPNDLNDYYADDFSPRLGGIRAGFILMLIIVHSHAHNRSDGTLHPGYRPVVLLHLRPGISHLLYHRRDLHDTLCKHHIFHTSRCQSGQHRDATCGTTL